MRHLLLLLGRVTGLAGMLVCAVALFARLRADFYVGPVQVGTLFQLGIAAMVFACLCLLMVITANMGSKH